MGCQGDLGSQMDATFWSVITWLFDVVQRPILALNLSELFKPFQWFGIVFLNRLNHLGYKDMEQFESSNSSEQLRVETTRVCNHPPWNWPIRPVSALLRKFEWLDSEFVETFIVFDLTGQSISNSLIWLRFKGVRVSVTYFHAEERLKLGYVRVMVEGRPFT